MSAVSYPTVLLGVGRFGAEVVERTTGMLDERPELLQSVIGEPAELPERLAPVLEQLLRAAHASLERKEPRLDLLVFASALQVADGELLRLCDRLAQLIGERYAPMFPADRPPEQRTAALHLIIAAPHLTAPPGARALQQLAQLEQWASRPAFPLLARLWIISQQSTAGTLTKAEIDATCAGFALALCGSGLRTEDLIARRLAHPAAGEGRVGFFSVASVDLPAAPLRRYAALRSELDGLTELVERVGKPVPDPAAALGAIATLGHEQWLGELEEGGAARRVRALAAELSGGGRGLPAVQLGPFDRVEDVRARHGVLFAPAAVDRTRTQEDQAKLDEVLTALDQAEAHATLAVERGLRAILDGPLGASTGLSRLPEVEHGLRRVAATLQDGQTRDAQAQVAVERDLMPVLTDPHRDELERAAAELPTRAVLLALGAATAVGVGFLVLTGVLDFLSPSDASAVGFSAPVVAAGATAAATTNDVLPWALGAVLGLGVGAAVAWLAGRRTREALRAALETRRQALQALWARGGGGPPQRQAEMQLVLRRQRVRRHAIRAIEAVLARLQFLRRTLGAARDRARNELQALQVTPAADASLDDVTALLGAAGELHGPLLSSPQVAKWIARSREVVEPTAWADRLLQATWPARGLREDVPCADVARLDALADANVRPLAERSVFESEELAAEAAQRVAERARRAAAVLAPACVPTDANGDRVAAAVQAQFVVAPLAARQAFEAGLRAAEMGGEILWTAARAPRVLFVSTWEGYTIEQVSYGASRARGRDEGSAR